MTVLYLNHKQAEDSYVHAILVYTYITFLYVSICTRVCMCGHAYVMFGGYKMICRESILSFHFMSSRSHLVM